ncbi:Panacea domain-containing protein [Desertibaculum subflavum]|uniref:Panacea domain-containing protein n=1 Tax=Desertibaculum subflavum TaxID=2268458 RepID=UPI0013C43D2F
MRSSLDVALWFTSRAEAASATLSARKLQQLMYLAQAVYVGRSGGAKLMPATFLASEQGPVEPTVLVALDAGLAVTPQPMVSKAARAVLEIVWHEYGSQSTVQLGRLIAADGLWRATLERGANSEITAEAMRRAYAPARSAAERMAPKRASTENTVRFTADGRMVLKWAPKRRIEKPAASARGT